MVKKNGHKNSTIVLEEYFNTQNQYFLSVLRSVKSSKFLKAFSERWKQDPRPWAREQLIQYLGMPFTVMGHHPLVKNLFKHAEARQDDELMGLFMLAFDRTIRRERKKFRQWDWESQTVFEGETLVLPHNSLIPNGYEMGGNGVLFSSHTRYYLRRRAWRYIRKLAWSEPQRYLALAGDWLARYQDSDFSKVEHILDNWGFIHACYYHHSAFEFTAAKAAIREGQALEQLEVAPYRPELWETPQAYDRLTTLLLSARSALVRRWARQMLEQKHGPALQELSVEFIIQLLENPHPDLQNFGADLFHSLKQLHSLPLSTWFKLLATDNPDVQARICDKMREVVRPDRLNLGDCLELSIARQAPVAQLGFEFLKLRTLVREDIPRLSQLAEAQCEALAGELAGFALGHLGQEDNYQNDSVIRFFDSLQANCRHSAWQWLTDAPANVQNDSQLWIRLLETPYDDLKLNLINWLERQSIPGAGSDNLSLIWRSVLLNIQRGSRQKLKALRQVSRALIEHPDKAEMLLPILGVAIRSVRTTEAGDGLAAVVSVIDRRPDLLEPVQAHLPELQLTRAEVDAWN